MGETITLFLLIASGARKSIDLAQRTESVMCMAPSPSPRCSP